MASGRELMERGPAAGPVTAAWDAWRVQACAARAERYQHDVPTATTGHRPGSWPTHSSPDPLRSYTMQELLNLYTEVA